MIFSWRFFSRKQSSPAELSLHPQEFVKSSFFFGQKFVKSQSSFLFKFLWRFVCFSVFETIYLNSWSINKSSLLYWSSLCFRSLVHMHLNIVFVTDLLIFYEESNKTPHLCRRGSLGPSFNAISLQANRRVLVSSVTLQRPPPRLALFTVEAISNSRAILLRESVMARPVPSSNCWRTVTDSTLFALKPSSDLFQWWFHRLLQNRSLGFW